MTSIPSAASDKVRILIVGDSEVGKTCLLHVLSFDKALTSTPRSTLGCVVEVKLFEYNHKPYFLELLEVGGRTKYESSRSVFYNQINGVILVHDLTNKQSYVHLKKWLGELAGRKNFKWKNIGVAPSSPNGASRQTFELKLASGEVVPALIVGTKQDLLAKEVRSSRSEEDGDPSLWVNTLDEASFRAKTMAHEALTLFFSRVIQRRFFHEKPVAHPAESLRSPMDMYGAGVLGAGGSPFASPARKPSRFSFTDSFGVEAKND
eukprot:TRINITY_DN3357_c1_g1_i1.p1 TRINITY_DN3357_c1_g1~~TRINITY_DN3357_c1_g1_i1.p1  ORF type:complete len:263 (+),score=57.29 TRINITY_DN3357_c1_g1_i1:83-871(+)